jgi:dephospho-CoA kinase
MSTERPRRASAVGEPFRVGVVGRAGSGKTTVARALASGGAEVIDADALGHQVTDEDAEVRAALSAEYGADVYGPAGLDRARVAARVFRDADARARLNQLVHPRILERIRRRFAALERSGFRGIVVVDAALLLDWGLERELDAVIAVLAPEQVQLERLLQSRGWTADEARRRLAVQRDDMQFAAAADVVLDNQGTPDELARAALEAVTGQRQRAGLR